MGLLVVTISPEVLLQSLIDSFGLAVAFRMISGSKVETHVEGLPEGAKEMGNEFRTSIGGDVRRNSVLGEHMEYEEFSKLRRVDGVMSGDEDGLLGETINDDENGGEAGGGWELFDEVHGDGRPGLVGDRELLECAKGMMPRCLSPATSRARTDIVLDEGADARPGVIPADELECLVVAKMAGEGMIVLVAEDTEPEIARVGDVDAVIEEE